MSAPNVAPHLVYPAWLVEVHRACPLFRLPAGVYFEFGGEVGGNVLDGVKLVAKQFEDVMQKMGVVGFTRALARELAPHGVTVNAVAPGVIPFGEQDPRTERLIEKTPMQRAGTADEIADAVVFFLTASEFITGQQIAVDGGLSQR